MKINRLLISFLPFCFVVIYFTSCNQKDINNGIQREYYPDGSMKTERVLKDGIDNGTSKKFNLQGKLTKSVDYENGQINGKSITYNPETGFPIMSVSYKKGIQDGPFLQYYEDGKVYRDMNYIKGKAEGEFKTFWPNGKIKAICLYHLGHPGIGLKEFDKNGKEIKQPEIRFEKINQLALLNVYLLKVSISNKTKNVSFYYDELIDGKYFPWGLPKLQDYDGVLTLNYNVPQGVSLDKNIKMIAKVRTEYGSELILKKSISFTVDNSF